MSLRPFSFLVLSYNDELHLPKLFESIKGLEAKVFVLDSGSTDGTLGICRQYGAEIAHHPFENHPRQWHSALSIFQLNAPWVVALDADQILSPGLYQLLNDFDDAMHHDVNGIYFNRKNFYKGKWIRYGGYFPFYMLKMFRLKHGISDLNENMDHRFLVSGKTIIWKQGYLLEENFKESKVQFWIEKHNRYSDLLALEEVERMQKIRLQVIKPKILGSPNERKAYLKRIWWKMPRFFRPAFYFGYRMTFQLGMLDGKTGIIFHFLQAFWFRLIVDIKIEELLKESPNVLIDPCEQNIPPINLSTAYDKFQQQASQLINMRATQVLKSYVFYQKELRFILMFLAIFGTVYTFNIAAIAVTTPGGFYWLWAAENCNYIRYWRTMDIQATSIILKLLGYQVSTTWQSVLVTGHAGFKLVYSCLGYGVMSFFLAFILAFPKKWISKIWMMLFGIILIQALNLVRFIFIALFWKKQLIANLLDHHTIFNIIIYLVILTIMYKWTQPKKYAPYRIKKGLQ